MGWAVFEPKGIIWPILKEVFIPNIQALSLVVSDKKIFIFFSFWTSFSAQIDLDMHWTGTNLLNYEL